VLLYLRLTSYSGSEGPFQHHMYEVDRRRHGGLIVTLFSV
jgi:hypothetical protein